MALTAQLLPLAISVEAEQPDVYDALRFLTHRAEQPQIADTRVAFAVRSHGGAHRVLVDGVMIDRAPTPVAALQTVFAESQRRLMARFPRHALLRCGVVRIGARRTLLVGEGGCGITSLSVGLLYAGAELEGDAYALVGADGLTPLPRRLLLRADTGGLAPQLAPLLDRLPWLPSGQARVWGFDPAEAGFEWRVTRGAVHSCVVVEANHGGASRLVPRSEMAIIRAAVARVTPPTAGGAGWLRDLSRLIDGTRCMRLSLGRIDDAVAEMMARL